MIFVNFKTYKEASGDNAVKLAQTISAVADGTGVEIISCPQAIDFREVVRVSNNPASPTKPRRSWVWAQNIDPFERGRATGWFPPEVAKEAGAVGTLLNHSEHKLSVGQLAEVLSRCKEVGLKTLVFADSVEEARVISKFGPDYIGFEPPELIASKTTSVSQAKPEVIKNAVEQIPGIPILIGAGVKTRKDVEVGIKLGAKGIVLSSAVVLADSPVEVLRDLIKGLE